MTALAISVPMYRLTVREAVLGRYRTHLARKVPELQARNQSIAQTRLYDFPNLTARIIGIELDTALETEVVRGLLETWK